MRLGFFTRGVMILMLSAMAVVIALSQARQPEKQIDNRPRNCSVSGQITINGAAAINSKVVAIEINKNPNQPNPIRQLADGSIAQPNHSVRANADGQYQFTGLPPGEYEIVADSRGYVTGKGGELVRIIKLESGESREGVSFSLLRGGVITGRITDAEGRPMIAADIRILRAEQIQNDHFGGYVAGNHGPLQTDDRGVFRIYGLEAGAYTVSAGGDSHSRGVGKRYPRTFYPNATSISEAKPIKVKLNEIVSDINLRLTAQGKYFEATGRVIESDTGQGVANVRLNCDQVLPPDQPDQTDTEGTSTNTVSNQFGNFRMPGLKAGKYLCNVGQGWPKPSEFYVEQSAFEISDHDISDVEIKVARGGVISGIAVIETANKQSPAPTFPKQMQVSAHSVPPADSAWVTQTIASQTAYINPDGTFRLIGIAPGKISFDAYQQSFLEGKTIQLIRIEREGTELPREFNLGKGEQITNVRIVYGIGTATIMGQVQIVGGQLPVGCRLVITANRVDKAKGRHYAGGEAYVDEKGRFEIRNLIAGEHEIRLYAAFDKPGSSTRFSTPNNHSTVQVANGAETRVDLTFDTKDLPKEARQ